MTEAAYARILKKLSERNRRAQIEEVGRDGEGPGSSSAIEVSRRPSHQ
jgi:hypothetical protein